MSLPLRDLCLYRSILFHRSRRIVKHTVSGIGISSLDEESTLGAWRTNQSLGHALLRGREIVVNNWVYYRDSKPLTPGADLWRIVLPIRAA